MLDSCYVGAYWPSRRESLDECTQRVSLFLRMLDQLAPSWTQWYHADKSSRNPEGIPVQTDAPEALKTLLLQGMNRATTNKSAIPELGFGFRIWNQSPDNQSTRLHIRCGGDSDAVENMCLMTPPSEGELSEHMADTPLLAQVLECMATAWDPDWGVVSTNLTLNLIPTTQEDETRVGWVTYISRRRGTVPPLPAPVEIRPVGTLGMVIILTPERFSASNPEHIALGRRVRELLERAGLLRQAG
ncbi:Imm52 family immunity protein [Stigmatella erecta]|uniref:Immunity protein 52 n=1 Tax=Stigmatella erecta TaxID=83460 RepID=A0A1I0K9N2_9BACT|nr:Immunity protein 52 [Stigmatella erecta]